MIFFPPKPIFTNTTNVCRYTPFSSPCSSKTNQIEQDSFLKFGNEFRSFPSPTSREKGARKIELHFGFNLIDYLLQKKKTGKVLSPMQQIRQKRREDGPVAITFPEEGHPKGRNTSKIPTPRLETREFKPSVLHLPLRLLPTTEHEMQMVVEDQEGIRIIPYEDELLDRPDEITVHLVLRLRTNGIVRAVIPVDGGWGRENWYTLGNDGNFNSHDGTLYFYNSRRRRFQVDG